MNILKQNLNENLKNKLAITKECFPIFSGRNVVFMGNFTILLCNTSKILYQFNPEAYMQEYAILNSFSDKIYDKLSNIFTLVDRIFSLSNKNEDSLPVNWRYYIGLDIEFIHIQIKSIMDFIATIINKTAKMPNQLNDHYNKLINHNNLNENYIDIHILNLINNSKNWFLFNKAIRDKIIHEAASSLVFGEDTQNGILFNIHNSHFKSIISADYIDELFPIIKYNENDVFYFDKYIIILLIELISYLEDFSKYFIVQYKIDDSGQPRCGCPNLIKDLLDKFCL